MSLAIRTAKAQGDPGLFGFLGKAVGTIAKIGTSLIPGPAGAIARSLSSRIFGGARPQPTVSQAMALPPQARALPSIRQFEGLPMNGIPQYVPPPAPFGPGGTQIIMPTGEVGRDITPAVACPQGYKPNKSGYYRRIKSPGNPEGSVFYIAPKSRCVKVRRRNAANPRAADRAMSRIQSAKRFATKMNRVTIRKKCD